MIKIGKELFEACEELEREKGITKDVIIASLCDALVAAYKKHIYEGCGKSLACRNICPANIDMDRLLVNSNAITLWKHLFKK